MKLRIIYFKRLTIETCCLMTDLQYVLMKNVWMNCATRVGLWQSWCSAWDINYS